MEVKGLESEMDDDAGDSEYGSKCGHGEGWEFMKKREGGVHGAG